MDWYLILSDKFHDLYFVVIGYITSFKTSQIFIFCDIMSSCVYAARLLIRIPETIAMFISLCREVIHLMRFNQSHISHNYCTNPSVSKARLSNARLWQKILNLTPISSAEMF